MAKFKNYNIEIDGSGLRSPLPFDDGSLIRDFETRIVEMLNKIVARKVGQQVLSNLPQGKTVKVLPIVRSGPFVPLCTAQSEHHSLEDDKHAVIRIDPDDWKPNSSCNSGDAAGATDDEVLLHEMLHAYRQLSGRSDSDACNVPPEKQYDTIGEFWAIVVTNIYMSEKGKKHLRQDHHSFTPLPPKWSTSVGFLSDSDLLKWSRTILSQEEKLLKAIDTSIAATTPFNPFHELLTNQKKYEFQSGLNDLVRDVQRGPKPEP
jgi:hypothetical protein